MATNLENQYHKGVKLRCIKSTIAIGLVLAISQLVIQDVNASESISSFYSKVELDLEANARITEEIEYTTDQSRHGIFRTIPNKYRLSPWLIDSTPFKLNSITDGQGREYQYTSRNENGSKVLKIGDPDVEFTGSKTYLIDYQLSDVVRREKKAEGEEITVLRLDVTGNDWQLPINKTVVDIVSPQKIQEAKCYLGEYGSVASRGCSISLYNQGRGVSLSVDRTINYGEGATVELIFDNQDPNQIAAIENSPLKLAMDNGYWLLVFLPGITFATVWYKKGRDWRFLTENIFDLDPNQPKRLMRIFERRRLPLISQPIHQLTPGQAGAIADEHVHDRDVIAEIIQLAKLKKLEIKQHPKEGWFAKDEYELIKLVEESELADLTTTQKLLFQGLFSDKNRDRVKIHDLENKFYTTFREARSSLDNELHQLKLFTRNPKHDDGRAIFIIIATTCASLLLIYFWINTINLLPYIITCLISAFLFTQFKALRQKTAVGYQYSQQARGLKQSLKRGAWRHKIAEKNLFIEQVFPFAVAFGVVDSLAETMKQLNIKPPSYLSSMAAGNSSNWASNLNSFSSIATSSMTSSPSSTSSGGSSSGGGFGGGGGDSW